MRLSLFRHVTVAVLESNTPQDLLRGRVRIDTKQRACRYALIRWTDGA